MSEQAREHFKRIKKDLKNNDLSHDERIKCVLQVLISNEHEEAPFEVKEVGNEWGGIGDLYSIVEFNERTNLNHKKSLSAKGIELEFLELRPLDEEISLSILIEYGDMVDYFVQMKQPYP